jgi:D-alanyl-lipoteichoic acid acyltransferase DltB (MBOAT superfamily)
MDSASIQFVLFGLCVAIISNFSRSRVWRSIVLMLASLIFLGLLAHNPVIFLPLAGFLLLGYAGIFLLRKGWSKTLVWSLLIVIFAYIWLKKYTFLPEGIFIQHPYFTLGLSYIFFRVLHLLIEIGEGGETRPVGLGAYLLYTLNFTTFVSGPIQRYDEFAADQFAEHPIPLGSRVIGLQVERLILGFFKVNVMAMLLEALRQDALAQMYEPLPLSLKMLSAFRLTVLCPFFLYLNFSGYIDIVIALARLMRVRLPENFNRPFSASSFLDFWSRWHITLSTWLKTYIYNPLLLAMMRRISSPGLQPFLGVVSFFVTFFIAGIWHGRTSEFLFFGLLQGGGVSINKLWQVWLTRVMGRKGYKQLAANPVYIAFGRGLTFSWFAFTLFWFWATWNQIDKALVAIGMTRWLAVWLAIWLCATVLLAFWEWLRSAVLSINTSAGPVFTHRYARVVFATTLAFVAFVMTILLSQPAPDIVYKVF